MQTSVIISKDHAQQGQALVEFALVLLFIILPFTFVLIDGAVTLFTLANVTNAAREGARGASIYQASASQTSTATDTARNNYARAQAQSLLGPLVDFSACQATTIYTPTVATISNPYRTLEPVTFKVACPRRLFFGLVGTGVVTLTAEATMRIEPGGATP